MKEKNGEALFDVLFLLWVLRAIKKHRESCAVVYMRPEENETFASASWAIQQLFSEIVRLIVPHKSEATKDSYAQNYGAMLRREALDDQPPLVKGDGDRLLVGVPFLVQEQVFSHIASISVFAVQITQILNRVEKERMTVAEERIQAQLKVDDLHVSVFKRITADLTLSQTSREWIWEVYRRTMHPGTWKTASE